MCATKTYSKEPAVAPSNRDVTPLATSTIVAIVQSNVTDKVMNILDCEPNRDPAEDAIKSQVIDGSDLTRDQWIQVL